MKREFWIMAAILMVSMTSCDADGSIDFTWLIVAIVVIGAIIITITQVSSENDRKKARKRGITVEQVRIERKENMKRQALEAGIEIEYLGGYPKWGKPGKANFHIKGTSIVLRKDRETITIPKEDIVSISNEKSGIRNVGKAAVGAIAGSILIGGYGLIAGGALGARRKDTSELYITYRYKERELVLHLLTGKDTDKLYARINSVFA